ncbi:integrase core domain-containing protein [Aliiroseovarius sp. PTFE2010]|uniref:integrase core domain-containing protein n=1 Tax=Aliiroseovarius sp. PTFE2010 TaxID=3417190 RepID=UPI003CE9292E
MQDAGGGCGTGKRSACQHRGVAVAEAKADIRTWIEFFNHKRPHTALAANPPL